MSASRENILQRLPTGVVHGALGSALLKNLTKDGIRVALELTRPTLRMPTLLKGATP